MTSLSDHHQVIGFSGHQALSTRTRSLVQTTLMRELSSRHEFLAVTSLAAGSDQIFAECVLATGNQFIVIIPCEGYELSFSSAAEVSKYRELLNLATDSIKQLFPEPGEEAYWAAGKRIVDMADMLIAVWDGQPAGGLGGTADVVDYAKRQNKRVLRIWPPGASRIRSLPAVITQAPTSVGRSRSRRSLHPPWQ